MIVKLTTDNTTDFELILWHNLKSISPSKYSSQAIEQLNRVLKRLVSSVSYMTPSNFKMAVTLFMASQNYLRLRMEPDISDNQNGIEIDADQ